MIPTHQLRQWLRGMDGGAAASNIAPLSHPVGMLSRT